MTERIRTFVAADVAKHETASRYLVELAEVGNLTEIKQGRDCFFLNRRPLALRTGPGDYAPFQPA